MRSQHPLSFILLALVWFVPGVVSHNFPKIAIGLRKTESCSNDVRLASRNTVVKKSKSSPRQMNQRGGGVADVAVQTVKTMTARRMETLKYVAYSYCIRYEKNGVFTSFTFFFFIASFQVDLLEHSPRLLQIR
jgi:hypothetical protein